MQLSAELRHLFAGRVIALAGVRHSHDQIATTYDPIRRVEPQHTERRIGAQKTRPAMSACAPGSPSYALRFLRTLRFSVWITI